MIALINALGGVMKRHAETLSIRSVTAPTLLIWGRNDCFLPLSAGEALHRTIPGSRLVVIPDAGHLPMWERPDKVNRLITEFLTGA